MWRRLAPCLLGVTLVSTRTELSHAQCAQADLVDTIPPDGASNVPTNTPLLATYELGATHDGESVVVTATGQAAMELAATYSPGVRTLRVNLPNGQFEPNTEYSVQWPALSTGGDRPRRGDGATVTFSVGASADDSRPQFTGATGVTWDFEREFDSCSDTESERYLFDIGLGEPSYSGGKELLSVIAFQTEGATLKRDDEGRPAPEPVYTQRYTGRNSITVKRPVADAVGTACFSVIMQAPSGQISQGAEKEVCTVTERPPFFDGCSLSTRRGTAASIPWFITVAVALGLRIRRRRASPAQRPLN